MNTNYKQAAIGISIPLAAIAAIAVGMTALDKGLSTATLEEAPVERVTQPTVQDHAYSQLEAPQMAPESSAVIRKTAEHQYTVSRAFIDEQIGDGG